MPKVEFDREYIESLYIGLQQETRNFTVIEPEILENDSKKLLIIRLSIGMSQNKFEDFIGKKNKNISKYESGKIKKMNYKTAKHIIDKLKTINPSFNLDKILENFEISKKESGGWFKKNNKSEKALRARRRGARKSLQKRMTKQESRIAKELEKRKIDFENNYPITESIIVDFYIKSQELIIECKEIKSENRREFKEQVRKLAYQGYKTKFKFPKIKLWALIESKHELSRIYLEELMGPYEKVFTGSKKLISMLS